MTTSIIPTLQNLYDVTQEHQDNRCTLQWRRGKLLVKSPGQVKQPYLPSLNSKRSLVECLQHSPVSLVSIDPKLDEALLRFWADACEEADKPMFLSIPASKKLPNQPLQRLIDWIAAFVLLLLASPVMLVLIVLIQVYSPGSLFCHEWRVGERGKLFRTMRFCTHNITPLGRWMGKYNLDNLPQLFNVLRGDMSLTGSRCWTLEDAVQLNKLPEITASWEVEAESHLLHLDSQTL